METIPKNYSHLYFRKKASVNQNDMRMDALMLQLLLSIDESKSISQIVKETGIETETIKTTLGKLLKLQLIEVVTQEVAFLGDDFISITTQNLALAVGPIASILIEDTANQMGFSTSTIPIKNAAAFVKTLAMEIPNSEDRTRFNQSMAGKIPKEKI
jgi:hypothetical protein